MFRRSTKVALFPVTVLFFGLAAAQLGVAHRADLPAFVGDRSEAIFDLWSLQHFCAGVLLGSVLVRSKLRFAAWKDLALVAVLCALIWEAAELAMEAGLFGRAVAGWKGSFEHWGNRFVGDLLMVTSGALLARRFSQFWKIVLLPAGLWLLINVTSPDSMHIQRLLFG